MYMFRAILYLRDVFSWAVLAGFHLELESLPAATSHPHTVASWDGHEAAADGHEAAADGSLLVPDPPSAAGAGEDTVIWTNVIRNTDTYKVPKHV